MRVDGVHEPPRDREKTLATVASLDELLVLEERVHLRREVGRLAEEAHEIGARHVEDRTRNIVARRNEDRSENAAERLTRVKYTVRLELDPCGELSPIRETKRAAHRVHVDERLLH